jgi:hypothetical protein
LPNLRKHKSRAAVSRKSRREFSRIVHYLTSSRGLCENYRCASRLWRGSSTRPAAHLSTWTVCHFLVNRLTDLSADRRNCIFLQTVCYFHTFMQWLLIVFPIVPPAAVCHNCQNMNITFSRSCSAHCTAGKSAIIHRPCIMQRRVAGKNDLVRSVAGRGSRGGGGASSINNSLGGILNCLLPPGLRYHHLSPELVELLPQLLRLECHLDRERG